MTLVKYRKTCWKTVNVARGEYGTMLDNHHQPQTDQPGLGATTTAPITGRNFVVRPPTLPILFSPFIQFLTRLENIFSRQLFAS